MAKASKQNKRKQSQATKATDSRTSFDRRSILKLARNGAIGLGAVALTGYFVTRSVQAMVEERDLTRIGQGKPVVVQVHDPNCPTCTALQRETRKAMKQFGECDMLFLVADITQPEGGQFARRYGVSNVTLLLFDANGALQNILPGMKHRAEIRAILAGHFQSYGAPS